MQKVKKFSVVFLIIVLYYFSTYILTYSPIVTSVQTESGAKRDELFEQLYDNVICNILKSDRTDNISSAITNSLKKFQFLNLHSIIETKNKVFHSGFFQYNFFSKNFPIRFRKENLIFPFNYFW